MKGKEDRRNFQGESKVENRLRIERRGIEKRSRVLKKKGIGQRKGKQFTDFEVIETDGCTPAGQSTPATHWSQEIK